MSRADVRPKRRVSSSVALPRSSLGLELLQAFPKNPVHPVRRTLGHICRQANQEPWAQRASGVGGILRSEQQGRHQRCVVRDSERLREALMESQTPGCAEARVFIQRQSRGRTGRGFRRCLLPQRPSHWTGPSARVCRAGVHTRHPLARGRRKERRFHRATHHSCETFPAALGLQDKVQTPDPGPQASLVCPLSAPALPVAALAS